jgi:GNAT superfamily N-acetyltransferase
MQQISAHSPAAPIPASWQGRLRDGRLIHIRPIDPADVSLERDFLSRLTPEGLSYRFLGLVKDDSEQAARDLTHYDPRELALAAIADEDGSEVEVGAACYRTSDDGLRCDCAVTVDPAWQNCGVGGILMQHLIGMARLRGIRRMYAADAVRSAGTHALARYLGFHSRPDPEDPASVTFELELND